MNRRFFAAVATTAALVAVGFTAATPSQAHADDGPPSSSPTDTQLAPDAASAAAVAAQYGHAVAVEDQTTETTQVSAEPDGTMQLESSAEPVRMNQDGTWRPLDLTLAAAGSWVAPAATASPIRFSAGGSTIMAEVQTDTGAWISETWPEGNLPSPTLTGPTATYADVLPGVDLRLTATAVGMAEVLVVKDEAAAANPDLDTLELGMPNATVSVSPQNATVAKAADGSTIASSSPSWWDSSNDDASIKGPGGAGEPLPLPHSTDQDTVTLKVGDVTDSPDLTYPIYIDPDWSTGQSQFWFTDAAYPTQSYLNGNQSAGYQSVGTANQDGLHYQSRAFWQFPTVPLEGKHIIRAKFSAQLTYSCATTPVQLWRYGPGTPGFTWNSDPGNYNYQLSVQNFDGGSGCAVNTSIGMDALKGVSDNAQSGGSLIQLALKGSNEADLSSRKHLSQHATLTVTYNSPPDTPTSLKITGPGGRVCGTNVASAAWINNHAQGIVLQVNQDDPDPADNDATQFQVFTANSGLGDASGLTWSKTTATQAQGTVSVTIPQDTLDDDTEYAYRAKTTDDYDGSIWSGYCYFHVQNTAPALPAAPAAPSGAVVGTPVTVTVPSPPDSTAIRGFVYWMSPTLPASPAPAPPSLLIHTDGPYDCNIAAVGTNYKCKDTTTTAITVVPENDTSTLYIASIDRAGNLSVGIDASGHTSNAVSIKIQAKSDPMVAFSHAGHSWLNLDTNNPNSIDDSPSSSAGQSLPIGSQATAGLPTSEFPGSLFGEVLSFQNTVAINRYLTPAGTYVTLSGGTSGSAAAHLGELKSPGTLEANGLLTPMTGLTALYSCALTVGEMTTADTDCENKGATPRALGYAWNNSTDVPTGVAVRIYRCTVGGSYYDTSSSTCDGKTSTSTIPLGYFVRAGLTRTASSVVDTTKAFTVTAWLRPTESLDAKSHPAYTAISQDGSVDSGFSLQQYNQLWRFCLRTQDDDRAEVCAQSKAQVAVNKWVFVSGIWDPANEQLRLGIGGTVTDPSSGASFRVPVPGDVTANGGLRLGGAKTLSASTNDWAGDILGTTIFQGIASDTQLSYLRDHGVPAYQ